MNHTQQYKDQPIKCNRPSIFCNLMEWNFVREKKHTKNRQQEQHSFEHITSHPLAMGIYSISANYSSHNSLSNGIIIIESFHTNINILVTKVGRKIKKPILGGG
jgi:hypothetical protein